MSMTLAILLSALIVVSGAVIVINLLDGSRELHDYWNLDNEYEPSQSKLDWLRSSIAFYSASAVLVASAGIYLWIRHSSG
ncbi:MAG: hypothetical protein EPN57_10645 [Paraburkholderia sp.]|nr:MAG: hypothetical protein EPN57_10645 [Paraburkholderia sp.]